MDDLQALIICAKPEELGAVNDWLEGLQAAPQLNHSILDCGLFNGPRGQQWEVFTKEVPQGNEDAAAEVSWALAHIRPKVAMFIGIAGGIKDVAIGDVVVASDVFGYQYGRDQDETWWRRFLPVTSLSFLPRGKVASSSYELVEAAKSVERHDRRSFKLLVDRPIASGNAVLAGRRSSLAKLISKHYSHCVAAEMEGLGFLRGTRLSPGTQAVVIRGVSDLLARKSETDVLGSQQLASANAAAVAFALLDTYADILRSSYAPPSAAQRSADREESALSDPALLATLENLYGAEFPLLEVFGRRFPIWARRDSEAPHALVDIDANLGQLDQSTPDDSFDEHDYYPPFRARFLADANSPDPRTKKNSVIYCMQSLALDHEVPKLGCGYGWFLHAKATSWALRDELLMRQAGAPRRVLSLEELPGRAHVHAACGGEPLNRGNGRCAEVAVSVLTVVQSDRPAILVLRRSATVASDPFRLHVAPSGKFQPFGELTPDSVKREFSIGTTVLREFAEELMGIEEAEGSERDLGGHRDPPFMELLRGKLADGSIELFRTGLAMSLLTLQPEVLCLIVVKDTEWFDQVGRVNWEYVDRHDRLEDMGRRRWTLTDDLQLTNSDRELLQVSTVVPQAVPAIEFGLQTYRQIA